AGLTFVRPSFAGCGHCKSMAADYESVSEIFKPGDGVVVAEYDADAHREFATKFGIKGFPTLKWFPKGACTALSPHACYLAYTRVHARARARAAVSWRAPPSRARAHCTTCATAARCRRV
ncbi:MAG: hypothetical protein EOO65_05220, partial [Methanosarcinales archaeon]